MKKSFGIKGLSGSEVLQLLSRIVGFLEENQITGINHPEIHQEDDGTVLMSFLVPKIDYRAQTKIYEKMWYLIDFCIEPQDKYTVKVVLKGRVEQFWNMRKG